MVDITKQPVVRIRTLEYEMLKKASRKPSGIKTDDVLKLKEIERIYGLSKYSASSRDYSGPLFGRRSLIRKHLKRLCEKGLLTRYQGKDLRDYYKITRLGRKVLKLPKKLVDWHNASYYFIYEK